MLPEGKCRYIDGQIYPDGNFYVLDTQHIKHNGNELKSALNNISTDISNKVDKVAGKGLSTEDYTTAEKNKLSGIETNANDYVHPTTSGNKHIPSGGSSGKILGWSADGTAAWVDPTGGGGGSVDTVSVNGTTYSPDSNGDVALPNYPTSLPASDVYSWAKASSKPTYTASEVGLGNVGNFKAVSTVASQGLSNTEKSNARTNIGAGTVTSVKVGSTSYSPSSGVVSLPEYVTFGTKGVYTKVMSSLVIRDGSYTIKNNIFYVANIFFSTISNVSANTETTLATASSLPTYELKAVATVYKNDNSSILTDSAILKIKVDGTVTITSPVAIGSYANSGRINNLRIVDLSV